MHEALLHSLDLHLRCRRALEADTASVCRPDVGPWGRPAVAGTATARSAPQATASKLTGLSPTRRSRARAGSVWRVARGEKPAASNSRLVRLRVTSAASARRASAQPAATAGDPAVRPVCRSTPSCVLEATTSDAVAATAGARAKSAAGPTRSAACQLSFQSPSAMSGSTVLEQAVAISEMESARGVAPSASSAAPPRTGFCVIPAARGAPALGESALSAAASGSRAVRTLTRICGGCADEQVRPVITVMSPPAGYVVCGFSYVFHSGGARSCHLPAPCPSYAPCPFLFSSHLFR